MRVQLLLEIASLVVSSIGLCALIFAFRRAKAAERTLALNAFVRVLDEFNTLEVRKKRKQIYEDFPDYTSDEVPDKDSEKELDLWIKEDNSSLQEKRLKIKKINEKTNENFEDVATTLDRLGFMFFELDLPEKFKKAYLEWMCLTIIGTLWNRLAPHILQKRQAEQGKYNPYFERLAYSVFPYYIKERKKRNEPTRLICIDKKLIQTIK